MEYLPKFLKVTPIKPDEFNSGIFSLINSANYPFGQIQMKQVTEPRNWILEYTPRLTHERNPPGVLQEGKSRIAEAEQYLKEQGLDIVARDYSLERLLALNKS